VDVRNLAAVLIGLLRVVLGAVVRRDIIYLVQKASDERRFRHETRSFVTSTPPATGPMGVAVDSKRMIYCSG
jgi:hypothetical protein